MEAVQVQRVPVDEDHGQPAPLRRRVRLVDLDVQLDTVVELHDLRRPPQLPETQASARRLAATQRTSDDDALGGHSSSSTNGRSDECGTGQAGTTGRVHDAEPPMYRRRMRGPIRVTISYEIVPVASAQSWAVGSPARLPHRRA